MDYVKERWIVMGPMVDDPSYTRYIATHSGMTLAAVWAGKQSPDVARRIVDLHNSELNNSTEE